MTDPLHVLRTSHDLFCRTVRDLDDDQVRGPSYAGEWSIADTASHLGSQAEIFEGVLAAGLIGVEAPGAESFKPIWAHWDAMAPAEQVTSSMRANEDFVSRIEGLSAEQAADFRVAMFGMELDLEGLAGLRLGEHALHTWDVTVALDPASVLPSDAVEVLSPRLGPMLGRAMRPVAGGGTVEVRTTSPESSWVVDLAAGAPSEESTSSAASTVSMPAEAWVRLVYGRLDADHTPSGIDDPDGVLGTLRAAFPGF